MRPDIVRSCLERVSAADDGDLAGVPMVKAVRELANGSAAGLILTGLIGIYGDFLPVNTCCDRRAG